MNLKTKLFLISYLFLHIINEAETTNIQFMVIKYTKFSVFGIFASKNELIIEIVAY